MQPETAPPESTMNFPIVGIGAAAGGFSAFKLFVGSIQKNSGMAFVLVQHHDPTHHSALTDLLTEKCQIPVNEIIDDIDLAPNHLYVIPENKLLIAQDGRLKLTPLDQKNKTSYPIDVFFRSLAEVHKSFAIGIVLSGTGFDGSEGVKWIKDRGGVTYSQSPSSALFDGMPQNAINSDAIDFVLPPEYMPQHLLQIRKAYQASQSYIDVSGDSHLINENARQKIARLEAELEQLHEDFRRYKNRQANIEKLHTGNKALMLTSKELQSLNEKVDTRAKELRSNNEEPVSVNDELLDRQEQLISASAQAQAIVETIRAPLVIVDSQLRIKSANQSFYDYFQTTESQTTGWSLFDLSNGQVYIAELKSLLEHVLQKKSRIENFEMTAVFPKIGQRTLLVNATQIFTERNADQLILLAFDDVTDTKVAELLRDGEDYFRTMADTAPVLLWISNTKKQLTFFNKSWLDFTGRTMEQEIGSGWTANLHPDDLLQVLPEFKRQLDSHNEFSVEFRLKHHNGDYRWIALKAVPRTDPTGKFAGYVGGCTDIHEQKNFAETLKHQVDVRTKELLESEAFLQSILNTTQNLIYLYDFAAQKIVFINKKVFEATGYTSEEIENADTDIFSRLIHPDDIESVIEQRRQLREMSNGKINTIEFRLRNKKGQWTCQLSRDLVFKRDKKGNALQYIGVATDITNLKTVNEQLLIKNKELERSNIELASFSSIASHDLKEPLRKIQLFSKLVIAKDRPNVSQESREFLDRVIVAANRMQQLIDDLISYSRTSSQKIVFTETDLNRLLQEVMEDIREVITESKAQITSDALPVVPVLPSQFRQLFLNLISNSIKYAREAIFPEITIRARNAFASEIETIGGDKSVSYLKITFADNGIGFDNEYSSRIFDPFQRLHGKDEYSGTGIGLAICRKIMINHKGFIIAHSKEGQGATFDIFIPVNK